jgi:predicted LPLAT superfamily acyltransferase
LPCRGRRRRQGGGGGCRAGEAALSSKAGPSWTSRPERGRAWALRSVAWIALSVGRPVARLLLHGLTLYFVAFSAADRAASRQFLRRALGREPGPADLYRHFHAFATTILDRVYLLGGQYAYFDVHVHGEEVVAGMLARGEGCLLIGSHLGSFEIVRFLGQQARVPRVTLVMYEEGTRQLNAVLNAINPQLAMQVIAMGKLDTMLEVENALAAGDFVGMLADRATAGEATVAHSFLGAPARFPVGPFRVAAILGRPVVLMFGLFRGGRRYDIYFERLPDTAVTARADRDLAIASAQRRYVERLEHYCRLAPCNWFNFYDYWK